MAIRAGIAGGLFGLAVGVAAAWLFMSRRPAPPRPPRTQAAAEAPAATAPQIVLGAVTARLGEDERESLRALIRRELQATVARAEAQPGASENNAAVPNEMRDRLPSGARSAYDEATATVDESIRSRTWTEKDRQRLRQQMADLPAEARQAVLTPLILAVNAGDVHFEGRGPLF